MASWPLSNVLVPTFSYFGVVELSNYVVSQEQQAAALQIIEKRLKPIPPSRKHVCFYPMSKKRETNANWFTLPFEERKALMHEHGVSGRKFAGRIVQYITGSTGLDDYEWGVTLFAVHPDDLKEVVYTMRFDEASAKYADFGPFYTGMVVSVEELVTSL